MEKITISFKKIKNIQGHEGNGYTAEMLINNKKIAEIFDYGDGGMGSYYLAKGATENDMELVKFVSVKDSTSLC